MLYGLPDERVRQRTHLFDLMSRRPVKVGWRQPGQRPTVLWKSPSGTSLNESLDKLGKAIQEKKPRLAKPRSVEAPIHIAILEWLRDFALPVGAVIWHTPNEDATGWGSDDEGAKSQKQRSINWRKKMLRMGMMSGFPDLAILYEGRLYALEVKGPDGVLSKNQKGVIAALKLAGAPVAVVRSLEEAETALLASGIPLRQRLLRRTRLKEEA